MLLMFIIVIGSSIWVLSDAKEIGVKKGQISGICDLGPGGWFAVSLGLWIVGFPMYLVKRPELKRINNKGKRPVIHANDPQDFEQQLTKLARLKESGVLSEDEFNAKKKSILGL